MFGKERIWNLLTPSKGAGGASQKSKECQFNLTILPRFALQSKPLLHILPSRLANSFSLTASDPNEFLTPPSTNRQIHRLCSFSFPPKKKNCICACLSNSIPSERQSAECFLSVRQTQPQTNRSSFKIDVSVFIAGAGTQSLSVVRTRRLRVEKQSIATDQAAKIYLRNTL